MGAEPYLTLRFQLSHFLTLRKAVISGKSKKTTPDLTFIPAISSGLQCYSEGTENP